MTAKTKTTADRIREGLAKEFTKGTPLPAARRAVEKRLSLASGAAVSFDRVYFVAIGAANPLPVGTDAKPGAIATAIRRRRDGRDGATVPNEGATKGLGLRRWETVAASASAALGRKVSVSDASRIYGQKESYTGKGTRAGAPGTREPIGAVEAV